jgi:hypothetical protein
MTVERFGSGLDSPLYDRSHEMDPAPGRVGLIAKAGIGGANGKAETALHTVEELLLLVLQLP